MNFVLMGIGIGWGFGVFCHDVAIERILHLDPHMHFHWTDGKILGPLIGGLFFGLGSWL